MLSPLGCGERGSLADPRHPASQASFPGQNRQDLEHWRQGQRGTGLPMCIPPPIFLCKRWFVQPVLCARPCAKLSTPHSRSAQTLKGRLPFHKAETAPERGWVRHCDTFPWPWRTERDFISVVLLPGFTLLVRLAPKPVLVPRAQGPWSSAFLSEGRRSGSRTWMNRALWKSAQSTSSRATWPRGQGLTPLPSSTVPATPSCCKPGSCSPGTGPGRGTRQLRPAESWSRAPSSPPGSYPGRRPETDQRGWGIPVASGLSHFTRRGQGFPPGAPSGCGEALHGPSDGSQAATPGMESVPALRQPGWPWLTVL